MKTQISDQQSVQKTVVKPKKRQEFIDAINQVFRDIRVKSILSERTIKSLLGENGLDLDATTGETVGLVIETTMFKEGHVSIFSVWTDEDVETMIVFRKEREL